MPLPLPLDGPRVRLVPAPPGLLDTVGWPKEPPAGGLMAIEAEGAPVGFLALTAAGGPYLEAVWLHPAARRRGLGVEAVRLLSGALAAAGARRVTAWCPAENGLLLYFWLRLGFAPVRDAAGPEGLLLSRPL